MPASAKTSLGLNQWVGNEYPKRQDFVDDNKLIDDLLVDRPTQQRVSNDITTAYNQIAGELNKKFNWDSFGGSGVPRGTAAFPMVNKTITQNDVYAYQDGAIEKLYIVLKSASNVNATEPKTHPDYFKELNATNVIKKYSFNAQVFNGDKTITSAFTSLDVDILTMPYKYLYIEFFPAGDVTAKQAGSSITLDLELLKVVGNIRSSLVRLNNDNFGLTFGLQTTTVMAATSRAGSEVHIGKIIGIA